MQGLGSDIDHFQSRRILVIDDNAAIHDDFRKIFTYAKSETLDDAESAFFNETPEGAEIDLDIEIDSAHQGQEGLQKVITAIRQGMPYAMAFVDMRMPPGWDGLTTIERIWEVSPDLQIVICSAYSDNSWTDICKRLGRSDRLLILKKPFDNAEVCQLALALTEKWNLARRAKLKREDLERLVAERTRDLEEKDIVLRQKYKLEAVGALAGGVAHEFNNLLQAIRGYTCFAREEVPAEGRAYEDLGYVIDATDRAAGIASQLLSFSRRKAAQKSLVSVNKIGKLALDWIKPLLPANIKVTVEFCNQPMQLFGDVDLLSQALLNIFINARDSMPRGGELKIRLQEQTVSDRSDDEVSAEHPLLVPGQYAVFSVSDTGCGISSEVQERIFEPFYTTKEVGKGTGMGLSIAFSALQDIDGAVTVESSKGFGSTFRVFMPVSSYEADIVSPTMASSVQKHLFGSETVLIAEDDEMVRTVAARTLRQAGYRVIEARDGAEAINQFQQHSDLIKLAILDLMMPELSGTEVGNGIEAILPQIKIIYCTGYHHDDMVADELNGSPFHVIQKPIEPEKFLSVVRDALDEAAICHSC